MYIYEKDYIMRMIYGIIQMLAVILFGKKLDAQDLIIAYGDEFKGNNDYLLDERANLNIQLSQPILVIAQLGLWNGIKPGYREIESGNIKDCLYSNYDFTTWFVDRRGDLRCDDIHHDGTNHYLYRVWRDDVSETQRDRLKARIYEGIATREDITRVTKRLGDAIGQVYGWTFPAR